MCIDSCMYIIDVINGYDYFYVANLSLHEMRCLYFKLKDQVFNRLGPFPHSDTDNLEKILKSTFGEHRKLGCKTYPK